jgi:hypothetical protein
MRRIAITAALAGLALLGIGTAATASAQGPIVSAVPALFHGGGAGQQTTDTPSSMASPGDGGAEDCTNDRTNGAGSRDAAEDVDDVSDMADCTPGADNGVHHDRRGEDRQNGDRTDDSGRRD